MDFLKLGDGMRKFLMLMALAMLPVLAMPEAAHAATAKPSEQEQVLVKKKKAAEARKAADKKAAEAKKARDKKAAETKKAAEAKKAQNKKIAEAKRAQAKKAQAASSTSRRTVRASSTASSVTSRAPAYILPPPARRCATCRRARTSTGRPPPNMPLARSSSRRRSGRFIS